MATANIDNRAAITKSAKRGKSKRRTWKIIKIITINAALLFGVFLTAAPYVYMIASTFKTNTEIWSWPLQFYPPSITNPENYPPETITTIFGVSLYTENYRYLFTEQPFVRWAFNTVFLATVRAAWPSSSPPWPGLASLSMSSGQEGRFLARALCPHAALRGVADPHVHADGLVRLAQYLLGRDHSRRRVSLLHLPHAPVHAQHPQRIDGCARIDGSTEFGIYWRIVVPIQKPAFGILAILAFNAAGMTSSGRSSCCRTRISTPSTWACVAQRPLRDALWGHSGRFLLEHTADHHRLPLHAAPVHRRSDSRAVKE